MSGYEEVADYLRGYFEDKLMGDGASNWNEYKSVVGDDVGPLDKDIWELLEKLDNQKGGRRKTRKTRKSSRRNRH